MTLCVSYFVSILLMLQSRETISWEPGKQVPQSVTVRVGKGSQARRETMHYLLFTPRDYQGVGKTWPLLLFLHGLGECGDNELDRVKIHGPAKIVESRHDFSFIVISPQCRKPPGGMKNVPTAWQPEPLIQLVDHVATQLRIDPSRVYVTGLSMGGYGTWRLVARYPERFAAALPICGGGVPREMASTLRRVPIWAFHGARDAVVPLSASQEMVSAVRCAGGNVRLTVYPEVEHDSWTQTYDRQEVYDWLLSHRGPIQ